MLKKSYPIPTEAVRVCCISVGLALITFYAFDGALSSDFLSYDDPVYVTGNYRVMEGFTWANIVWAFEDTHTGNWYPLTWLSHMLDCQLYGLNPMGHHLTSIIIHVVNVLILFLLFWWLTGGLWQSAFAATLFAIHPLRVESVVWVSERKDVLSGLFFLLTIITYAWYLRRPSIPRYLLIMTCLCAGLMAKPMLVTLPFVLLLLDYWPLERLHFGRGDKDGPEFRKLILEKVPLFIIAVVSSIVAMWAQRNAGAITTTEGLSVYYRLLNSAQSYMAYIWKFFCPKDLAVLYPLLLRDLILWKSVLCILFLVGFSVWVIYIGRRHRYFVTGWFWYMGMLVPVIGLVQIGSQVMADRYTYLPSIGFLVMITWALREVAERLRVKRVITVTAATIIMILLMFATWIQVGYWKDSVSLFAHAIDVTDDNHVMHLNLALALEKTGEYEEAINHYYRAMSIAPWRASVLLNVATIRIKQGRFDEAISNYEKLLKMKAGLDSEAYCGLGTVYLRQGKLGLAEDNLRKSLSLDADYPIALNSLARVLHQQGKTAEAVNYWKSAIKINAYYINAMSRLAWVLATTDQGDIFAPEEAVKNAVRVCNLTGYEEPQLLDVLAAAYAANESYTDAIETATKAYELAMAMGKAELAGEIKLCN